MQSAWVYRSDLFLEVLVELFYVGTAIIPLLAVFAQKTSINGWNFADALGVAGVFTMLQGVMEGLISPSLLLVIEQVQKGTFDFVLLRPVDSQLLSSLSRLAPFRLVNLVAGAIMLGFSLHGHPVSLASALMFVVSFGGSVAILYSLWLMAVSLTFRFGRLENLPYFIVSWFDAARWPRFFYRGALALFFTYVFPLAVMTSYPALALRAELTTQEVAITWLLPALFLLISRVAWKRALGNYTSASS
jgi:ABC-2 type transport system permease protein